ncbi:hypothetical protein [Streptomyces albicerus]|uniref:hypothetical protein n=1 Tax=Streptomyces albicerus TaxID=2569859 RepID=UPI00124B4D5B|nr:hypothetical protein [Streptomyces albicerus]
MGVQLPDETGLPPGPRRDMVVFVHELYQRAGKPSLRDLSEQIRARNDLPGTLSHDGVSSVLKGRNMPRWPNLKSLVHVLAEQQQIGEPDVRAAIERVWALWCVADGGAPWPSADPPAPSVPTAVAEDHPEPPALPPGVLIRWAPQQGTLDVFDRQMAVEVFRKVGGIDEQS